MRLLCCFFLFIYFCVRNKLICFGCRWSNWYKARFHRSVDLHVLVSRREYLYIYIFNTKKHVKSNDESLLLLLMLWWP